MYQIKTIFKLAILISSATLIVFKLSSCSCRSSSKDHNFIPQTDALIQTEKLTDKVIIIRFDGEAVTAIETQKGIVVVDAGIATGLTSHYRERIEKEFHQSKLATLIITHGHHDHYGGSSIFSDAIIVAHENTAKAIVVRWKDPDKVKSNLLIVINEYNIELDTLEKGSKEWIDNYKMKIRFQSAYDDIMNNRPAEMPDKTFSDTLSISMGDMTFNMIWFGKAHSESDILIHVPELKMLFTGDLFSKYGRPSVDDLMVFDTARFAKVKTWTEARMDHIQIIVGGHGQILTKEDLQSFYRIIRQAHFRTSNDQE